MRVTDPRDMWPTEWASQNMQILQQYGVIPILHDDDDWREWALIVIQLPGIAAQYPPDPRGMEWVDWSERFSQSVEV